MFARIALAVSALIAAVGLVALRRPVVDRIEAVLVASIVTPDIVSRLTGGGSAAPGA